MAVKTLSTNRYSQLRLNSTNVIPASAYTIGVGSLTASYLVVAGGGGGGSVNAGGGGGGYAQVGNTSLYSGSKYVIIVGAGGVGGVGGAAGIPGGNSIISSSTSASFFFNGTSSYLTTPAGSYSDFGGGAFTVEMWIYPTVASTQQVFVFHGWSGSGGFNYGWNAQVNASNQLQFYANGTNQAFTDLIVRTNAWSHVAFVGNGGVLSAYLNGVKSTTTLTYTAIVDRATATTVIGGWNNNNELIAERLFYTGYLTNLRIIKGTALYTSTFTVPTAPLTTITNTVLLIAPDSSSTLPVDLAGNTVTIGGTAVTASVLAPFYTSLALSQGGGGGGGGSALAGLSGGNGGGGSGGGGAAGAGTQGFAGGLGPTISGQNPGGGGGGSTGVGAPGVNGSGGAGGAGLTSSITTTAVSYGGGGGGGIQSGSGGAGNGGGGAGAGNNNAPSGTAFTGGGGGGGGGSAPGNGGAGGSGIVVISHSNAYTTATVVGSPTISNTGGNILYIFTASGTITFGQWTTLVPPPVPTWPVPISSTTAVNAQLSSTGTTALTYTLVAGSSLPAGVSLSTSGLLSGTASVGTYTFSVSATDAVAQSVTQIITLTVSNNVTSGMSVSSVYVTDSSYTALTPTRSAVSTSGGYVSIVGLGFSPTNKVYIQGIPATTSTYVSATQINAQLPAYNTSTQSVQQIYVVNTLTNSAGILITGFLYSVMPYWNISSSQALVGPTISASLAALSDSALVYSLYSGTLPGTLTLNTSTGLISGTVSVETSTSVVILATDLETQTNTQTFTLSIIISDPNLMYNTLLLNGETTVKPFNADASTSSFEVAVVGDTRPSNVNPYSNGFYSTNFSSASYITAPANTVYDITGGDFTVEFWVNFTAYSSMASSGDTIVGNFQNTNGWLAGFGASGAITYAIFGLYSGGANTVNMVASGITSTNLPLNTWNHMAYVQSGANFYIFLNGVSYSVTGTYAGVGAGGQLAFGVFQQNLTYSGNPNVNVSNLRIVKGTALYTSTATFTPPTGPLTIVSGTSTVFLGFQSSRNIDNSMHGATLTSSGATPVQPSHPFASTSTITVPTLYSVKLPASTDYLSMPINPSNSGFGTGDFTVEAWIYPTVAQTITIASSFYNYSTSAGNWAFYFAAGSATTLYFNAGSAGTMVNHGSSVTTTVQLNQWSHVAYSKSSSVGYFFVNGVQIGTGVADTSNYPGTAGTALYIGRQSDGTGYLTGSISNLRIVKGIAVYTGNFTVPTSPLTVTQSSGTNIAAIVSSTSTTLLTCQSSTIIDNSPVNPVITSAGSAQPVTATPFTQVYAAPSVSTPNYYSVKFNGSTDYLTVPDNAAFDMQASDYTIEGWCYILTAGNVPVVSKYSLLQHSFWIGMLAGGTWDVYVYYGASSYLTLTSGSVAVSSNAWHHFALVRNGANIVFYADGVQIASVAAQTMATTSWKVAIGGADSRSIYFNGYVSNVRIVKGTALYTTTFTPSRTPLTATTGTVLLTCQDAVFKDNSTNTFIVTAVSNPIATGVAPFVQTYTTTTSVMANLGSSYFDGTGDYLSIGPFNGQSALVPSYVTAQNRPATIEFWVYPTTTGAHRPYSYSTTSVGNGNDVGLYSTLNGSGSSYSVTFGWYNQTVAYTITGGAALPFSWTHIALTYNPTGGLGTLYVNGINVGTVSGGNVNGGPGGTSISNAYTYIGYYAGGSYLTGYMSDVRYVSAIIYNANFAPPTAPLTAIPYTQLLTCQNNQAVNNSQFLDMSSNSQLITRAGDTSVGTFAPFGNNWSNYFNGTSGFQTPASSMTSIIGTSGLITSTFTIEVWIFHTVRPGSADVALIGDMAASGGTDYWSWGPRNDGKLTFYWYTGSINSCMGSSVIPLSTWTHIALVIATTSIKMFVNGVLETLTGTTTLTSPSSSLGYLSIGMWNSGISGNTNFAGYASNLRITKAALYSTTFTPSTTPLTATTATGLLICQSPSFVDNSPNSAALTLASTPTVQKFSPFANYIQTPTSYSTKFNGSTDYLTAPANAALSMGTGDFTWEMWLYPITAPSGTGTSSNQMLFGYRSGSDTSPYLAYNAGSGGTNLNVAFEGDTTIFINSNSTLVLNQWSHLAVTRSGTALKMFINGTVVGSATNSTNFSDASLRYIGAMNSTPYYFPGYISNLRIVKGTALYTANFTPSTTPLTAVANTSLLTLQDATIKDNSTSTFTLTATGSPTPKTFNPFGFTTSGWRSYTPAVYGGSAYFDGTGDYLSVAASSAFTLGTNDHTIEFWMYLSGGQSTYATMWKYGSGSTQQATNDYYFQAGSSGGGSVGVLLGGSGSWAVNIGNTALYTLWLNVWTHVAITRSGSTFRLFANGAQVGSATYAGSIGAQAGAMLLANDGASNLMTGMISNFRLINGTALYTSNFVPPTAPTTVIAKTVFQLGYSPAIADFSMQNNLECFGDAKISTAVKKFNNASLYFDGTGDYLSTPYSPSWVLSGDFTIELWLYWTAHGSYGGLVGSANSNTGAAITAGWFLDFNSTTNNIQFEGQGSFSLVSTNVIPSSQWVHIAVVRSGSTITHYLNGVANGSGTSSTAFNSASYPLLVGIDRGVTSTITGYIDDLRITKGVARYTANFTTATSAMITL